jgi:hypothetical protein
VVRSFSKCNTLYGSTPHYHNSPPGVETNQGVARDKDIIPESRVLIGVGDHEDFVFRINGMGAERTFAGCFADVTETPVIRASLKKIRQSIMQKMDVT